MNMAMVMTTMMMSGNVGDNHGNIYDNDDNGDRDAHDCDRDRSTIQATHCTANCTVAWAACYSVGIGAGSYSVRVGWNPAGCRILQGARAANIPISESSL